MGGPPCTDTSCKERVELHQYKDFKVRHASPPSFIWCDFSLFPSHGILIRYPSLITILKSFNALEWKYY